MWGGGVSTLFDIGFQQGSSRFRSTGRTGISGEYIVAFATVQTLTTVARNLDHINSAIMEQVTP